MWYTPPNAGDEPILNKHFSRDVIEESKLTEKNPIRYESSKNQTKKRFDDESPLPIMNALRKS